MPLSRRCCPCLLTSPRLSFLFWRQATFALVSQLQDLPPAPSPHLLCSLSSRLRMAAVLRKYTFTRLSFPDLYSPCITQPATLPPASPPSGPGLASRPCSSLISSSSLLLLSWDVNKCEEIQACVFITIFIYFPKQHIASPLPVSALRHKFFSSLFSLSNIRGQHYFASCLARKNVSFLSGCSQFTCVHGVQPRAGV